MFGTARPLIAFGPRFPGAGSWEWMGEDLAEELNGPFETITFDEEVPECDVVVFIKQKPPAGTLRKIRKRSAVIYSPIDRYGSLEEIDTDEGLLACDQIVAHCPKLAKYFRSYGSTVCLDHHLKYTAPIRQQSPKEGPLLWVGVRSNLPPLIHWLESHRPPDEIWVLTNPEQPGSAALARQLGLPTGLNLRVDVWSPERHLEWLSQARAALDIKGSDFRSRHKPATKALDFLASGVPLAMNSDSSPVEFVRNLGFDVASPEDRDRWLSAAYWNETVNFAETLHQRFSRSRIGEQWRELIEEVLRQRRVALPAPTSKKPRPSQPTCEISRHTPNRTRVAIVSLLFNWPSTGGGTVHTFETARFLAQAGYDVRHFYVQSAQWNVGNVEAPVGYPGEPIPWEPETSNLSRLQGTIGEAVNRFAPDFVIVTDSWSMKPRLAEAVQHHRFFLRLAAQECLCPLNNVRMLIGEEGSVTSCPRQQLVTPGVCQTCVDRHKRHQGTLHRWERELAGFGTTTYDRALRWAIAKAEAVLVVNPLIEAMVAPFARQVHVVPSGFDPARFPWPWPESPSGSHSKERTVILFAGLIQEWMKGYHVLEAGCRQLAEVRDDFEVWVTEDPIGQRNKFTRAIGWQSQEDLPGVLHQSDIVVFPTVAEEALGRTAVEAMAAARPVVASRIGGLPWTIPDGGTGLLFEPGNPNDLAEKLDRLLGDVELRQRLGANGRKRFEAEYTWDVILNRHYFPLLGDPLPSTPSRERRAS